MVAMTSGCMGAAARPELCASIAAGNLKPVSHALKRDVKPTDNDHMPSKPSWSPRRRRLALSIPGQNEGGSGQSLASKKSISRLTRKGSAVLVTSHVDLTLASPYRLSMHPIRWDSTNSDRRCSLLEAATP